MIKDKLRRIRFLCAAPILASVAACATVSDTHVQRLAPHEIERVEKAGRYGDYLSARYAGLIRDEISAANYYKRALERDPDSSSLLERAVTYALIAGDYDGAVEIASHEKDEALRKAPLALLVKAVEDYRNLRFEKVAESLDSSELTGFNGVLARGLSAWAHAAAGDAQTGAYLLEVKSGSRQLDGVTDFTRGMLRASYDMKDAALDDFNAGWRSGIRLPTGVDMYARLAAAFGNDALSGAIVDRFYTEVGDNPLVDRVAAELNSGRTIAAPVLKPGAGASLALLGPATLLAAERGSDVAAVYYFLALELDPGQDQARVLLADALKRMQRDDEALSMLADVRAGSVYAAVARAREADIYYERHQDDKAAAAVGLGLTESPGRSVKMQLGEMLMQLEGYAEAERVFDAVAQEDASSGLADWRVIFARGRARERLNLWAAAEADLITALNIAPERPEVLNYLGYSWVDRGRNIDEAFILIKRADELKPGAGYIVDSLGWAYYRMGRYELAVRYLEKAASLAPSDETINDHLGDAYWRMGLIEQARYQWMRVKLYGEDESLVHAASEKLGLGLDVWQSTPVKAVGHSSFQDQK